MTSLPTVTAKTSFEDMVKLMVDEDIKRNQ